MAALALVCIAEAQSPAAFEAASIRPNLSGGMNTRIDISGERLTITNASVKTLIRNAYDILSFQLAAEPRWLDTEMYDIVATAGSGEKISPDRFRLLLQSLLADRFRLKVHWATRETSVYALVMDRERPGLKESHEPQEPGINTQKGPGGARMKGSGEPISILATNLGNQLGRFVIDRTGLHGEYDWMLEWDPVPTPDSTKPSLFTALQVQLGLRLKAQKGPMEVLVVDRVERPSEN
jgi:uncharacterized protein (TIGR03435 family)